MSELEMKLHCLQMANGDVVRAQEMYLWLTAQAPAQPVHPEAELRSVTPATEEDRGDQTQAFEIPAGFTRWDGGEWTGLPTDRVQVIFCDEPTPYVPIEAENLDPLWCWDRCPPDAQRIIAYRILEAPALEQEIPDGFTKWEGGECPVPYGTIVEIMCRDPNVVVGQTNEVFAGMIDWGNGGNPDYNIIAYRVVEAPAPEQPASVEVLDATVLPQVTPDEVPPTAEVIHTDDGRKRFALFSGQTHEVVSGSGNPDADFWAGVLHPKPKVDA